MAERDKKNKLKRKAFYRRCAAGEKRARQREQEASGAPVAPTPIKRLEPGMTGILLSSNNKEERHAMVEAYRLLNEAHDRLNDSFSVDNEVVQPTNIDDENEDWNITSALREEMISYDAPKKYNFRGVKSGVSNCAFILNQSSESSTADIVYEVFRYVAANEEPSSRHILRFQPVLATCRPDKGDLRALVCKAWKAYWDGVDSFADGKPLCLLCPNVPYQRARFVRKRKTKDDNPKKYFTVNFRARNYDKLTKSDAVMAVLSAMQEVAPDWSPITAGADLVISVDVLCNVLCLSFLERYSDYAKYNIHELAFSSR